MLPKLLYELLPFLYLGMGLGSGVAINSAIVLVASALLIVAGIIVLSMRVTYRRKVRRLQNTHSK